jgi:uncharacterized surface protein with fasciclin (FAS1) repeats
LFEWLILCVWTFGIGVGAALLLWHWPRRRMVWLVVWPVLALGWNFAVVTASVSSPPPAYAVGLLMMTMCQSATMWAGGWLGRGLLVRIASVLLPPSFVAELRQLWGTSKFSHPTGGASRKHSCACGIPAAGEPSKEIVMFRPAQSIVSCLFAITLGVGLSACKSNDMSSKNDMSSSSAAMPMAKMDIIDTATGPGMEQVTTLVKAIQAAGLVDALKGPGPFTVFAPTNEAFAKLPPGTLDDLLKPENKDKLTAILLYHVHKGDAIMAADVHTMQLSTMNGKPLNVVLDGNTVMVNGATVVKANIVCSNGVIHWIDQVLMP